MDLSRTARRLALVAILAAAATVVIYVVTIATRTGQLVGALMLGGRPADPAASSEAEAMLSAVTIPTLLLVSLVAALIAAAQGRPRLGVVAFLAVAGANVTTQLLKEVVIERADLLGGMFYPLPNSFPSGHTTAVASLAVASVLVAPPVVRLPVSVATTVIAIVFGIATIEAGWHRMADAVGGFCIAVAWGGALGAGLVAWRGVDPIGDRTSRLTRMVARSSVAVGTFMTVGGALVYLIVALDPLDALLVLASRGGSPDLYILGVTLTVGSGMMAFGGLTWAVALARLDRRQPTTTDVPAAMPEGPDSAD
jgi:membrane-associated phospholipid phosphatase